MKRYHRISKLTHSTSPFAKLVDRISSLPYLTTSSTNSGSRLTPFSLTSPSSSPSTSLLPLPLSLNHPLSCSTLPPSCPPSTSSRLLLTSNPPRPSYPQFTTLPVTPFLSRPSQRNCWTMCGGGELDSAPTKSSVDEARCRLPRHIVPEVYRLHLTPCLTNFVFSGEVSISLKVYDPASVPPNNLKPEAIITYKDNQLVLHGADLVVKSARIALGPSAPEGVPEGKWVDATSIDVDTKTELITLTFPDDVHVNTPGNAVVQLVYTGILNDKMSGFYRSSYTVNSSSPTQTPEEEENATPSPPATPTQADLERVLSMSHEKPTISQSRNEYMGVTQFEAVDARRALPCFDEPAFKARFIVSMTAPSHLSVLSNMPLVDEYNVSAPSFTEAITNAAIISKSTSEGKSEDDSQSPAPVPTSTSTSSSASSTEEHWTRREFAATPIMSTYLLAFAVGEFEYVSRTVTLALATEEAGRGENGAPVQHFSSREVEVRVYTTPGKRAQANYALDIAVASVRFFEQWFGIEYPLPKLDLVAVPDFNAGAMENFGLITFREVMVLVDPENTAADTKQEVALTVAHEVAHQWFGNLCTMDWWSDLWLNEGFATWSEYLCVDSISPEFRVWDSFLTSGLLPALTLDRLSSSHPVEVDVAHPGQIDEIFDSISYNKGCAVIRMLAHFMGAEAFRKGISSYLNTYLYKNATTRDLWSSLEASSGLPIKSMMQGWTRQVGYPMLTITPLPSDPANPNSLSFTVEQHRFVLDKNTPGAAELAAEKASWFVPLEVILPSGHAEKLLLRDAKETFTINDSSSSSSAPSSSSSSSTPSFCVINPHRTSFCVVHYPNEWISTLTTAIKSGSPAFALPTARAAVIADTLATVRDGKQTADVLLSVLAAIAEREDDYFVWEQVNSTFLELLGALKPYDDLCESIRRVLGNCALNVCKRRGWDLSTDALWVASESKTSSENDGKTNQVDKDAHLTSMLKGLMGSVLLKCNVPEAASQAASRFTSFVDGNGHCSEGEGSTSPSSSSSAAAAALLSPDVRGAVYSSVARNGGQDAFKRLMRIVTEAPLMEEQERAASALALVSDPALVQETLTVTLKTFDKSQGTPIIRLQDVAFVIAGFRTNTYKNHLAAWEFVKKHWDQFIFPAFEASSGLRHVISLTAAFASHADAEDVEKFFTTHKHTGAEMFLKQTTARIRAAADWGTRDKAAVEAWVKNYAS